jgi:glycine/D-amino acid oxidase-like deaminating enzyme
MSHDVIIIGAGIVGLATAAQIQQRWPALSLLLLEKEHGPALHQSGRNSGVVHAGVYYEPGSLKARFSSGYGFDGLVVGLLARGSIAGVIAAALLFGFLRSGGISMEMQAGVPSALVLVIQGVIILLLAGAAFWIDRRKEAER